MPCSHSIGLLRLFFLIQLKNEYVKKIKKLIFDHSVTNEHANENSAPPNIELVQEEQIQSTQISTPSTQSSNSNTSKRKCLFSNIQNDQKYSKKTKTIDSYNYIKEEISRYLNDTNNDNMLLLKSTSSKSYNALTKLATKYLCIPATTALVERVFSQSGFLCRPHRARMTR
ncbi:unnamed protein product, partial [Adineta ricciae]